MLLTAPLCSKDALIETKHNHDKHEVKIDIAPLESNVPK